jgi:protein-L-isoaspartate(D-aspartate) O-methyltransferase
VNTVRQDDARAARTRNALVDTLVENGTITAVAVERAFRAVPRHLFVADGTPLEVAYNVDEPVAIKRDADGVIMSSTSAASIQARMIEQAALTDGMSVLEIGSGGYNAALLAEVVGPGGRVVSVDIDPEVTARARALLDATGYGSRARVVTADADTGSVGLNEPVDAILVTAGAWDLAPAWLTQLSEHGRIVVPLRMNGITRAIGFRRDADHLVSTSAEVCGFVPMRGSGAHDERCVLLRDGQGHNVKLSFDDAPRGLNSLDGVLATNRTSVWSGVTVTHRVSFADLHLWFASFLPGFCKVAAEDGTELAAERESWFPFAVAHRDSFAYLVVRPTAGGDASEFGAAAYGAHGGAAAAAMVDQIQAWERQGRGTEPTFAYWPTGADRPEFDENTVVLEKKHGLVTISWPRATDAASGRGAVLNTEEQE